MELYKAACVTLNEWDIVRCIEQALDKVDNELDKASDGSLADVFEQ